MLRVVDGFDNYGAGNFGGDVSPLLMSSGCQLAGSMITSSDTPHNRGKSVLSVNGSRGSCFRRVMPYSTTMITAGFNLKVHTATANFVNVLTFENIDSYGVQTVLISLGVTYDGRLQLFTGAFTGESDLFNVQSFAVVWTTTPNVFPTDIWGYLEIKCVVSAASLHIVIRRNNNMVMVADIPNPTTLTTINSIFFSSGYSFAGSSSNVVVSYDDLYMLDNLGSEYNDFLTGMLSVVTLLPNRDASPNTMTMIGGGGANHYTTQNDPMVDTTLLWSSTLGDQEIFGFQPVPPTAVSIIAVVAKVRCDRDSGLDGQFVIQTFIGGSEQDSPPIVIAPLFQTYAYVLETPPTSSGWQLQDVNMLTAGFKITGV